MSPTSIHEAIDTDGKFFVKNDVGDYENVNLYKLMISKEKLARRRYPQTLVRSDKSISMIYTHKENNNGKSVTGET